MTATLDRPRSATVEAGGYRTRYLEQGEGEPVVLLHGSGPGVSADSNWSRTIPALARRFRVLAPEMVGFGDTDRAEGLRYTMRTWVDHVVAFLDALQIPRAGIVGNSLGGMVTLLLARHHPDRVRRMVLMGSPGVGVRMTEGLRALRAYEPSPEAMRDLLRTHFAYDPELVTDDLVRVRYEASARPGEADNYRAIHKGQMSPDNEPFTEELVRGIDVPALLVHGRDDRVLDAELSWRMAGLLPNAELHVFPRCGHWAQLEHAEAFNELVGDFFARPEEGS